MRSDIILEIVRTDATFERMQLRDETVWVGKCIHCRSRVIVTATGKTAATVEHIIPQNHGGTDALNNLALACKRCNHLKGKRMDWRRADDPQHRALTATLQAERLARWRTDMPKRW